MEAGLRIDLGGCSFSVSLIADVAAACYSCLASSTYASMVRRRSAGDLALAKDVELPPPNEKSTYSIFEPGLVVGAVGLGLAALVTFYLGLLLVSLSESYVSNISRKPSLFNFVYGMPPGVASGSFEAPESCEPPVGAYSTESENKSAIPTYFSSCFYTLSR